MELRAYLLGAHTVALQSSIRGEQRGMGFSTSSTKSRVQNAVGAEKWIGAASIEKGSFVCWSSDPPDGREMICVI